MDFAKIIRASDGEQVLFFLDSDDVGNPSMACMTEHPDGLLRIGFGFPDSDAGYAKRDKAFQEADIAVADKVRRMLIGAVGDAA